MSEESATPAAKDKPINPLVVGIMMALVALLAPLMFSFTAHDGLCFGVLAVLWSFTSTPWGTRLETSDTFTLGFLTPFGLLRLAYAYQMVRLYKGRTTKKRTLALGIVSELPIAILLIPVFIMLLLHPDGPMVLFGPTFILLTASTLIIRLKSPPQPPELWEEMS
ncbi:MAG: hypothetical protein ACTSV9_04025 [Candidatus Thorarchaeota archaeon]